MSKLLFNKLLNSKVFLFFIEVWLNFNKKEYLSKLDACNYDFDKKTYILSIKVRNKNIVYRKTVDDVFSNRQLLQSMHPLDAYLVGAIKGMVENGAINELNRKFKDYDQYYVTKPILKVVKQPLNILDECFEIQPFIKGSHVKKISIVDLCKNPFLIEALGHSTAATLGFLVSGYYQQSPLILWSIYK